MTNNIIATNRRVFSQWLKDRPYQDGGTILELFNIALDEIKIEIDASGFNPGKVNNHCLSHEQEIRRFEHCLGIPIDQFPYRSVTTQDWDVCSVKCSELAEVIDRYI
jgi:hypothetical protein